MAVVDANHGFQCIMSGACLLDVSSSACVLSIDSNACILYIVLVHAYLRETSSLDERR